MQCRCAIRGGSGETYPGAQEITRKGSAKVPSWDTLTSTEVGRLEELHTLIAGQQMRARPGWGLGCVPGDGDGAKALNKEASGIAGHQDASLELIQQALGRLQWVGFGKLHLLHAALGV